MFMDGATGDILQLAEHWTNGPPKRFPEGGRLRRALLPTTRAVRPALDDRGMGQAPSRGRGAGRKQAGVSHRLDRDPAPAVGTSEAAGARVVRGRGRIPRRFGEAKGGRRLSRQPRAEPLALPRARTLARI